jgi:thiosulfate/3-mercaptopyruvate sulfurtransferase
MSPLPLCLTLALLVTMPAGQDEASQRDSPLVDTAWLSEHLEDDDLVVLQVGERSTFEERHIPGAIHAVPSHVSAPEEARAAGGLVLELPDPERLQLILRACGITDTSTVVVVFSDGWITGAARVEFTLQWAGLGARARFLDGGLQAWEDEGRPTDAELPRPRSGTISVRPRRDLVVDAGWITEHVPGDGLALLDARPGAYYDGLKAGHVGRAGHIPGAASLPWLDLIDEEGRLRPAKVLAARFASAGVEPEDVVVGTCHIGQYATLVLLAARSLGHEVRLYDGSFEDWANRALPLTGEASDGDEG